MPCQKARFYVSPYLPLTFPTNLNDNPVPDAHPIVPFPFSFHSRFLPQFDGHMDVPKTHYTLMMMMMMMIIIIIGLNVVAITGHSKFCI